MRLEDASAEFHDFFERHHAELVRLAYLLTGEPDAADDIAADALVALWQHWDRFRRPATRSPTPGAWWPTWCASASAAPSASGAGSRCSGLALPGAIDLPDMAGTLAIRAALARLPFRKRACVVLRHAFDLPEQDTAMALGISVVT